MNRFLNTKRLTTLFFGLFAVMVAGTLLVQRFWIDPSDKCEASGRWWYAEEGRCVTPTYLPDITKRAPGVSRAEASAAKNRELVAIEAEIARQKAVIAADVVAQRAALTARE